MSEADLSQGQETDGRHAGPLRLLLSGQRPQAPASPLSEPACLPLFQSEDAHRSREGDAGSGHTQRAPVASPPRSACR